jgi:hypothetical protein
MVPVPFEGFLRVKCPVAPVLGEVFLAACQNQRKAAAVLPESRLAAGRALGEAY